jgi:hypothetical protein
VNFFRLQGKGITLEQMQQYKSTDADDTQYDGVCADDSPGGFFGGAWPVPEGDDSLEVVVFTGHITQEIYDGVVVKPAEEIARFSVREWRQKLADETAWDYEDWG